MERKEASTGSYAIQNKKATRSDPPGSLHVSCHCVSRTAKQHGHNVKSKQSAPGSNELREPFRLQSTQVIKLNQQQEAFSAMQHVRVQLRSSLKARSETVCSPVTPRPLLSFGHHYKQARCFNPDQTNTKPIDQCHLHVSSMSENVVRHRLRCHPLIRQVTLKMTGANLQ